MFGEFVTRQRQVALGHGMAAEEVCAKIWEAVEKMETAKSWNFGLRATRSREPRQARKGATVPGKPSVPRRPRSSSIWRGEYQRADNSDQDAVGRLVFSAVDPPKLGFVV